jgi:hypothetical protein
MNGESRDFNSTPPSAGSVEIQRSGEYISYLYHMKIGITNQRVPRDEKKTGRSLDRDSHDLGRRIGATVDHSKVEDFGTYRYNGRQ